MWLTQAGLLATAREGRRRHSEEGSVKGVAHVWPAKSGSSEDVGCWLARMVWPCAVPIRLSGGFAFCSLNPTATSRWFEFQAASPGYSAPHSATAPAKAQNQPGHRNESYGILHTFTYIRVERDIGLFNKWRVTTLSTEWQRDASNSMTEGLCTKPPSSDANRVPKPFQPTNMSQT